MLETDIIHEENSNRDELYLIQKYEHFIEYFYPIAQNIPSRHGVFKEKTLSLIFEFVDLVYDAGKTNQVSKLYLVDSCLSKLRFRVRFMSNAKRKHLTRQQQRVCQSHLAESGRILGTWIKKHKGMKKTQP